MADGGGLLTYISTVTSVIAIAVSSLTLGWTIYRDAIRKPKLRVDVAVKTLVQKDRKPEGPYLFVEALNMGPIPNRVGLTFARKSWIKRRLLDRKSGTAMIYPDFAHWAATKASTRLEVGDTANFIFPYSRDMFLKEDFLQVGVADGFGQIHWSTRRDLRSAQRRYQKDFVTGKNSEGESAKAAKGVKERDRVDNPETPTAPAKSQEYYHSYKG